MKKNYKSLATSLTTFTFLVISITGVLMFFHIFDKYTKQLHEILGLVFVLVALFHVLFNWKSMKNYFNKKSFILSFFLVSIVSLAFIFSASKEGENPKRVVFNKIFTSSLHKSLVLFDDYDKAIKKLENSGLKVQGAKSIIELSKINNTSPFRIISIISKR